jgi:hypothetical protein
MVNGASSALLVSMSACARGWRIPTTSRAKRPFGWSIVCLGVLGLWVVSTQPAFSQNANDGFDPNANGIIWAMAVQADGKIIIGGDFTAVGGVARNYLARLNEDGTLDTAFTNGADGNVRCLAMQADGKILVQASVLNGP